jgi:hypothetical protein
MSSQAACHAKGTDNEKLFGNPPNRPVRFLDIAVRKPDSSAIALRVCPSYIEPPVAKRLRGIQRPLIRGGAYCMSGRHIVFLAVLIASTPAYAQQPAPPGMSLAEAASRRYPQPVRVADLLKRQVLQPLESQPTLGRVRNVVKRPDGGIDVVVDYGGVFGLFARPIAVPVEAMALLGEYMEILDFTPAQLNQFNTFDVADAMPLPPDSIIRVGLAKPSH